MKNLQELTPFSDRWTYLYHEFGQIDRTEGSLVYHTSLADTPIPINKLSLLMLGPGTTITAAAVELLARHNCLVAWTGRDGTKMYSHSTGGTFSSRRLLRQARMFCDEGKRLEVVRRMYGKRFPGEDLSGKTLEQIRGMEGYRVREAYRELAASHGIEWVSRSYDQNDWSHASPVNRALSAANACLYGICHAAMVSAGWSAAIGFVHVGKMLSFVYDIADLYKTRLTVPLAFRLVSEGVENIEQQVRRQFREAAHRFNLMERLLPDIAEVIGDDGDATGEGADELEGRAVSLADEALIDAVRREHESKAAGPAVAEGLQSAEGETGVRPPDVEQPE